MKQFFKIISFSYLIVLSIALLIPLDLFIITQFVEEEKQPTDNLTGVDKYMINRFDSNRFDPNV